MTDAKQLIAHVIAGYPDLGTTSELVKAMASAGLDMAILEIPFSDPIAGGPEIQVVCETALSSGVTTDTIFDMIEDFRKTCDMPIAIMTYYNPIYRYGKEAFVRRCADAGVGYVMVPDMPFEERGELQPVCDAAGIDMVTFIAPTYEERMRRILSSTHGLVYMLCFNDLSGFPEGYIHEPMEMAELVHSYGLRCIRDSGKGDAGSILEYSDGAVDGTDVMSLVMRNGKDCVQFAADHVRGVRTRV